MEKRNGKNERNKKIGRKPEKEKTNNGAAACELADREFGRQLIHGSAGVLLILFLAVFGREYLMFLLAAVLLAGSLVINWKMLGSKIALADWFAEKFERPAARFPGYGSAWYVAGALMLAVFLNDYGRIAAGIWLLGIGDAASTVIGMRGKNKMSHNPAKTWEGMLAFFVSSLFAYFFIGWLAIPLALLAAIAESLPLPYDDNMVIPAVCVLFFALV